MSTLVLTAEIASPFAGIFGAWNVRRWWRRSRYRRCLASIAWLELELGFGEGPGQRPSFSPPQILASPYSFGSSPAAVKARHDARAAAESKEENPALYAEMVKRGLR